MPVNFFQVQQNLKRYSEKVKKQQEALDNLTSELFQMYAQHSDDIEKIHSLISQAIALNNKLWCACPTNEPLLAHFELPTFNERYTIMAADGSQITPNRHKALQYCVINVGVIRTQIGSGRAPETSITSELLDHERLYTTEGTLIDEDTVGLMRDFAEREALANHVTTGDGPVLTLVDGPLGLFHRRGANQNMEVWQNKIHQIYKNLHEQGVITAGYIDKPGSDMIGRLFNLVYSWDENANQIDPNNRHFKGISDANLLSQILKNPGERSAVFRIINSEDMKSENSLDICFFYLNIGQQKPYLVRIEFPAFVANHQQKIDFLHAVIYKEVRVLENHPYPYILHRAHELAVIRFNEYAEVERLIMDAYNEEGITLGIQSNKEINKIISNIK
jgi:hypothetical protein